MLEDEAHLVLVDLLDALDDVAQLHGVGVGVAAGRKVVGGVLRIEHALEAEQHVVGVEFAAWLEVVGAVEFHALAQAEGVDEAVSGDVPAFRQGRDHRGAARSERGQRVVQRMG